MRIYSLSVAFQAKPSQAKCLLAANKQRAIHSFASLQQVAIKSSIFMGRKHGKLHYN